MKKTLVLAVAIAVLPLSFSLPASAQRTGTAPASATGITYPWQQQFWGYAGVSVGGASYDINCFPGSTCDEDTGAVKIFAGGRFNNIFGLEVGYINLGKAENAGGDLEAHGLNFSLLAAVPIGTNTSVFGKVGTTYGRTKVSGTVPAVRTGTEDDWGLSFGIGAQFGVTERVALRLDADRYRFQFVDEDRRNIDTLTIGVQYRF